MHGQFILIMNNSAFALLGIVTSGYRREGIQSPAKIRRHVVWNELRCDVHTRGPTKEALYSCNLDWERYVSEVLPMLRSCTFGISTASGNIVTRWLIPRCERRYNVDPAKASLPKPADLLILCIIYKCV